MLGIPYPNAERKPLHRFREITWKPASASLPHSLRGDYKMIALKLLALALVGGTLLAVFAGDFGPDFILALVACLS
jgi:hypothetical protein